MINPYPRGNVSSQNTDSVVLYQKKIDFGKIAKKFLLKKIQYALGSKIQFSPLLSKHIVYDSVVL